MARSAAPRHLLDLVFKSFDGFVFLFDSFLSEVEFFDELHVSALVSFVELVEKHQVNFFVLLLFAHQGVSVMLLFDACLLEYFLQGLLQLFDLEFLLVDAHQLLFTSTLFNEIN